MSRKRARRHFSQLSELEKGLIIGRKTAGWSTCRVAGQVDRSECAVRNYWEQWTREDTLEKQILNPSAFSVHRLYHRNIGNCVYSGAKPDQCGMSQFGKMLCLVMNPGLFWGQMITVYGCGGALTTPWPPRSPNLSPLECVRDQLKRKMPSCHSVPDLELVVQDLWAHLPQDNIRCLINSMPDRVASCIRAGGGPTRY
ncbi:uncharacterized protein TNCV_2798011 [Trichonephila clavipes]|nr:uncharacterized protein TNCV_2798011 [Trichonephila clavipes]